jgi:DNA-binding NarL/FixJ family response regulator
VRIFLITNNHVLINAVQSLLVGFATVASGTPEDHEAIRQATPRLIILDIQDNLRALSLLATLKDLVPDARTLLLAGLGDIAGIRGACRAGIDGIVLTIQPHEALVATVRSLMPPQTARNAMAAQEPPQQSGVWPRTLTTQECKIVELVSQGLSNKEIADRVCISPITVRHHLTNIFDKLGVTSRQNLIVRSLQLGTVP